jgi:hippurate hydrolase
VYTELAALAEAIAEAYGLGTVVEAGPLMTPTVSTAQDSDLVRDVVVSNFGADRYRELVLPDKIAEDFSQFLEVTGGAFVFLGAAVRGTDVGDLAPNHSPMARFDDGILYDAAQFLAELVCRRLRFESDSRDLTSASVN